MELSNVFIKPLLPRKIASKLLTFNYEYMLFDYSEYMRGMISLLPTATHHVYFPIGSSPTSTRARFMVSNTDCVLKTLCEKEKL